MSEVLLLQVLKDLKWVINQCNIQRRQNYSFERGPRKAYQI